MQADVRLGDRLLEGIKDSRQPDQSVDAMRAGGGLVSFVAANVKQSAVNFRMQRFHAGHRAFWKACVFADCLDRQSRVAQRPGVPPG